MKVFLSVCTIISVGDKDLFRHITQEKTHFTAGYEKFGIKISQASPIITGFIVLWPEQAANFEEVKHKRDLADFLSAHLINPYSINMIEKKTSGAAFAASEAKSHVSY